MKRIRTLFVLLLIFIPYRIGWTYGIVTATSTRDSIAIPFAVLDSMGKAVDLASGDSLYLVVFSPGGSVVYKDSMAYNNTGIKSYDWSAFSGGMSYVLSARIDSLNGTSTAKGVFTYVLTVDDNTGANLTNTYMGQFQIVDTTFDQSLNKIKAMLDTLLKVQDSTEAYDNWVTDSGKIDRVMAKVSQDSSLAKTGAGRIWALRGLHVRGTTTGDTAIIADANSGNSSRGFFIRGGNAGLESRGTGTVVGVGIVGVGSNSGAGMQLEGGTSGDGLLANGYGAGHAGIRASTYPLSGAMSIMADDGIWAPSITGNLLGRVDSVGDGGTKAFWNKPFGTSFVAGSIGDSLTNGSYVQGAASGLDSAIVEGAAKAALQAGIDASFGKIHATNLIVVDAADDDTGGVYVHSPLDDGIDISSDSMRAIRADAYGSRPTIASYAHGSGDGIRSEIVTGATGSGASLNLLNSAGQTTTGYSLRATSNAGNYTVYFSNTADALLSGAMWMGAEGDSASTLTLTQGSNNPAVKTVQVEGTTVFYSKYSLAQAALMIHGTKPYPVIYVYGDSSAALWLSTSHPEICDSAVVIGGNTVYASGYGMIGTIVGDIHGKLDTVLQANHLDTADYIKDGAITATLSGTGTYSVQLLILDTLPATDAPIIDANVTIRNLAQTNYVAWDVSDINGLTSFNLDTGQYAVLTRRAGCGFPTPDTIHVTGIMTDTVMGYNTNASKTCATSVVVYGQDGDPLKNVVVTAQLLGNNLRDSTGNPIGTWIQASKTDSTGEATFNCLWSSYIIPSTKWRFAIQSPLFGNAYKDIAIPRSTSYQVSFIK